MMRATLVAVAAALAALVVGCGTTADPAPVKAAPVKAVSAPQVCLDALDKAEKVMEHSKEGFDMTAEMAGAASDGFMAAAQLDAGGINAASDRITAVNEQMEQLTPKMTAAVDAYTTAAAKCRAV